MKLLKIISIFSVVYLMVGVFVYWQGLRSQMQMHLCPPDMLPESPMIPDCPRQGIDIKREIITAPTITVGWLPIIIGRAFSERGVKVADDPVTDAFADSKEIPGLGIFHSSPIVDGHKSFASDAFGISFRYPAHYALFENESTYGDGTSSYHYFTAMPEDPVRHIIANKLEREWPPSLAFLLYKKSRYFTTLEDWIRTHSESNFIDAEWADKTLTKTTVAGVTALSYRVNGMYLYEYTAFIHGDHIILASLAKETGEDFGVFLGSVELK